MRVKALSQETDRIKVVFLYGSGRCGSTVIDMALGTHARITSLGEIATIRAPIDPLAQDSSPATRALWSTIARAWTYQTRWAEVRHHNYRLREVLGSGPAGLREYVRHICQTYVAASNASGSRILTDASKSAQRLYPLVTNADTLIQHGVDLYVVHIVRDGRAVTSSYARRYDDFFGGLKLWILTSLMVPVIKRHVRRDRWVMVRYEDFATSPHSELSKICQMLNIDFQEPMTRPSVKDYSGVGGSPTTLSANGRLEIRLDEGWRERRTWIEKWLFATLGGWLNLLQGYRPLKWWK